MAPHTIQEFCTAQEIDCSRLNKQCLFLTQTMAQDLDLHSFAAGFDTTDDSQLWIIINGIRVRLSRFPDMSEAAIPVSLADVEEDGAVAWVDQQIDVVLDLFRYADGERAR